MAVCAPLVVVRPAPESYHLGRTLALLRLGRYDPAMSVSDRRAHLGLHTPDGPVGIEAHRDDEGVWVRMTGPGAAWTEPHLDALLGLEDPADRFRPEAGPIRRLARQHAGMHLPRLPVITLRAVQIILLQLVTSREAMRCWRRVVERLGEPMPGSTDLRLPPSAGRLAATRADVLVGLGVLPRQARTVLRVAAASAAIESAAAEGPGEAARVLGGIPGFGTWSVAYVAGSALGVPDAVLLGDYNLPALLAWTLHRERRADDERMLALMEPYRGHRFRVTRLLWASGVRPPRRAPRHAERPVSW